MNVLVAVVGQRREVAPTEVVAREDRLAVDAPRGPLLHGVVEKRNAGQRFGDGFTDSGENRREEVRDLHRQRDPLARAPSAGELDEERNPDRLAVEKDAVLVLAVVAESLAVVGEEHDERAVVDLPHAEKVEKPSGDRVRRRDLAVVGVGSITRLQRLRRLVGRVRLVEVEKREEAPVRRLRADPALEPAARVVPGPLKLPDRLGGVARLDGIVVEVEALADSGPAVENDRRDGAARRVPARLQPRREGRVVLAETVSEVVAHAVLIGKQPGEERRVRWQRQGHVRDRVVEDDRVGGQAVEVRGFDL